MYAYHAMMPLVLLLLLAVVLWCMVGVIWLLWTAGHPPGGQVGEALARGRPLDPGEAGLTYTSWTLSLDADVALPVWDITGCGDGPVTVLVHDWGEAPLVLLDRAIALSAVSRRIIVPSLRGHVPKSGRCRLGQVERNDLERVLEHIAEPVVLEGRGMGGYVIQSLSGHALVSSVQSEDPWHGSRDGLARIMADQGFPGWPIVPLASLFVS